jgi:hypothetical protein
MLLRGGANDGVCRYFDACEFCGGLFFASAFCQIFTYKDKTYKTYFICCGGRCIIALYTFAAK